MIEYISTLDPHVAALVGVGVGVWMPDEYSNDCVRQLADSFVRLKSGRSADDVQDDLLSVDRSNTSPETDEDDDSEAESA